MSVLELADLMRVHGTQLARFLVSRDKNATQIHAEELRRSDASVVFKVAAGTTQILVKAFDPSLNDAMQSWKREVGCQTALSQTGLIPPMIGHSEKDLLVISTWQDGHDLRQVLSPDTLEATAHSLGTWYRNFTGKVQSQPVNTNWYDYLMNYSAQGLDADFAPFAPLLQSVEIHEMTIAKNDAHLSNFISDPDGKLIGIDFEEAALKPVGWDILLTARVLQRQFPLKTSVFLPALLQGWGQSDREPPLRDFAKIAEIFAQKTAFKPMGLVV